MKAIFLATLGIALVLCGTALASPDGSPASLHHPFDARSTMSSCGTGDNTSLPTAFDCSLGNNFTQPACSDFFDRFLADPDFIGCHPMSMLLQTSSSFIQALKSPSMLSDTLDAACQAPTTKCAPLMSKYATELHDICHEDLDLGNPSVQQAYDGFVAYNPIYEATCLSPQPQSSASNSTVTRCFEAAATDRSNPSGYYLYFIPLGISLPGGSNISCSWCLQQTMAAFLKFAGNKTQPLSNTYVNAAQQIDELCGPTFVQQTVTPDKSAAAALRVLRPYWAFALSALVVSAVF